jgi:hypothetical protein
MPKLPKFTDIDASEEYVFNHTDIEIMRAAVAHVRAETARKAANDAQRAELFRAYDDVDDAILRNYLEGADTSYAN